MNKFSKFVALATVVGAASLMAQSASAAPILLGGSGQNVSIGNNATIASTNLDTTDTYYFTFSTSTSLLALEQIQATLLTINHNVPTVTPELVSFSLFNGIYGSGTLVGSAGPDTTAVFGSILPTGWHYIVIGPVSAPTELLTGGVTALAAPAPEPATWLSMIAGFGMLGGLMRFTRRATPTAA